VRTHRRTHEKSKERRTSISTRNGARVWLTGVRRERTLGRQQRERSI